MLAIHYNNASGGLNAYDRGLPQVAVIDVVEVGSPKWLKKASALLTPAANVASTSRRAKREVYAMLLRKRNDDLSLMR